MASPAQPRDFNTEEARAAWLRHGLGELKFWLQHIDEKTAHLVAEQRAGRIRYIEQAELIFDYCALINRLAQIDLHTEGHIKLESLVAWLSSSTGWPLHVADSFWYCVRNPTLHVGRAWSMADYGRKYDGATVFAGLHPDMSTDHGTDGWLEWPKFSDDEVRIEFYLPGVRTIVDKLIESVAERLRTATEADLRKSSRLNERIPFFYVSDEAERAVNPPEEVERSEAQS